MVVNVISIQINITSDHAELRDVQLVVKRIECELVDDRLFWKGTITGDIINIVGENCLPIKPSVDLEAPAGMTKYYFNMGSLRDMGVHLQLTTPAPSASSSSSTTGVVNKRCFKCGKTVPLSIMQCHVAKHILKGELAGSKTCGFCGRDICTITLKTQLKT